MGVKCPNMSFKMPELEKIHHCKKFWSLLSRGSSLIHRRTVIVATDCFKVVFFPFKALPWEISLKGSKLSDWNCMIFDTSVIPLSVDSFTPPVGVFAAFH